MDSVTVVQSLWSTVDCRCHLLTVLCLWLSNADGDALNRESGGKAARYKTDEFDMTAINTIILG
jgi:hypothetical protein